MQHNVHSLEQGAFNLGPQWNLGRPVVVVTTTRTYHRLDPWPEACHLDAASDAGHIQVEQSVAEAVRLRHRPCRNCFPLTAAA